jgi:uncharacterized coiled-coil protein SlyX
VTVLESDARWISLLVVRNELPKAGVDEPHVFVQLCRIQNARRLGSHGWNNDRFTIEKQAHSRHALVPEWVTGYWRVLSAISIEKIRESVGVKGDEAGVVVEHRISVLGHANLSTTSRYLNIQRRELHRAVEKLEAHQQSVAQRLHNAQKDAQASVEEAEDPHPSKPLVS